MNNIAGTILPIAIDVMGGDLGPAVVVRGAVQAGRVLDIPVMLVGKAEEIRRELKNQNAVESEKIQIVDAREVITMEDSPSRVLRTKPNSSMKLAYELVNSGKASAIVSPGNTGAMLGMGLFLSGTIPGISRPAIATTIPKGKDLPPTVMLDSGANIQCNAEQLVQFGIMGSFYAKALLNIKKPRIGLLSNGTEDSKGTDLIRAAAYIFSKIDKVNYTGFIEGRHLAKDSVDVVVCDGFTGNVVLKSIEGAAELFIESIRDAVSKSIRGKIGMFFARPIFKYIFQEKLDPSAYGGAPLLGINCISIICHGSSNEKAIYNAIRVANQLVRADLVQQMKTALLDIGEIVDDVSFGHDDWSALGGKFDKRANGSKKVVPASAGTEKVKLEE